MIHRPDRLTLGIGLLGVLVLFVPIPLVTQVVGLPMVVYACYRYWGRDDLGSESWGVREAAGGVAADLASGIESGAGESRVDTEPGRGDGTDGRSSHGTDGDLAGGDHEYDRDREHDRDHEYDRDREHDRSRNHDRGRSRDRDTDFDAGSSSKQ